jgi:DNA-3-methyladenine glycosylase
MIRVDGRTAATEGCRHGRSPFASHYQGRGRAAQAGLRVHAAGILRDARLVMRGLPQSFFARSALDVAAELIGAELTVDGTGGVIVETEAYLRDDPASHSFKGPSLRNRSMFGEPGLAYVYNIYGLHWCLNAVCLPGSAVLIRALAPTQGLEIMERRRRTNEARLLCSGPGRLAEALGIGKHHDGLSFAASPFALKRGPGRHSIATGKRIGISKAADQPWRFGLKGSAFLSRRFEETA